MELYQYSSWVFRKIRTTRILMQASKNLFFNLVLRYNCDVFDGDLNGRNQSSSYRETGARMSTGIKIHCSFSDYQDSDAKTKSGNFSWEWFATCWKLPFDTLMEEVELDFSHFISPFLKTKGIFFLITGLSGFCYKGERQRFPMEYLHK